VTEAGKKKNKRWVLEPLALPGGKTSSDSKDGVHKGGRGASKNSSQWGGSSNYIWKKEPTHARKKKNESGKNRPFELGKSPLSHVKGVPQFEAEKILSDLQ